MSIKLFFQHINLNMRLGYSMRVLLNTNNMFCFRDMKINFQAYTLIWRPLQVYIFYPFVFRETSTNSENPDEIQHNAVFQQGLHCTGEKELQTK